MTIEVSVATASVIIALKDDPYMILVADSQKHPYPVIPGGKIDKEDCHNSDLHAAGFQAVIREAWEETEIVLSDPQFIGMATDPNRDVRTVPFSKIKESVTVPELPQDTPDDTTIKASYGCPDYIYRGLVERSDVISNTEELSGIRFIDIRNVQPGSLSAGHDVVVLWYRMMLDNGLTQIPEGAMRDFAKDRADVFGSATQTRTVNTANSETATAAVPKANYT